MTEEQAVALRTRYQDGAAYVLLPDGIRVPEREEGADWWDGDDGDIYCDARVIVVTEWGFRLEYSPKHSEDTDFLSSEVPWATLDPLIP